MWGGGKNERDCRWEPDIWLICSEVKVVEAQRECSGICDGGGRWEFTHTINPKHFPSKLTFPMAMLT